MHCVGTKSALAQIPLAFVNPGDIVIATEPGYPVLQKVCTWLGAEVCNLKLERRGNFLPDLSELEDVARRRSPKLLLLNYPNNPTGAVATAEFMAQVVDLAHRFGFIIVQDAAYSDYVFQGDFHSPLVVPGGKEVCLELYSLSKSYNMQGYRLGFVAGSAPLVKAFALVKDNTDNGQFIAIQMAGIEALDQSRELLDANRTRYRRRLERTATILTAAGIPCTSSPGTFYLYVPVPELFQGQRFTTAQEMTDHLIARFGIITVPWDEAGPHVRFSMTFEVGTRDFADEDAVFAALESRLVRGEL
jgi:LL-diaminopimelate aminotransferase